MFKVFVKDVLIDVAFFSTDADPLFGTPSLLEKPGINIPINQDYLYLILNMQLEGRDDFFKIWVGKNEGVSIAEAMRGFNLPRPNSHDTAANIITKLGATLEKVVITDLIKNTFHASITLRPNGPVVTLDSRPSDAIALAIRLGAPIFVTVETLKKISNDGFNDLSSLKGSMEESSDGEMKPEDFM